MVLAAGRWIEAPSVQTQSAAIGTLPVLQSEGVVHAVPVPLAPPVKVLVHSGMTRSVVVAGGPVWPAVFAG